MKPDPSVDEFYEFHYKDPKTIAEKVKQAEYFLQKVPVKFKKGSKLLEPGCGVGVLTSLIAEKFSVDVYGIELSKVAAKEAKEAGVKVKLGNLEEKWDFATNSFDYVVNVQVIEHLLNPDHFLLEAKRVLKPGGFFILTTPNLAAWFNRIIFLFGFQPFFLEASTKDKTVGLGFTRKLTPNRKPLGHIRVFTLPAIKDLLRLNGFDVLENKGGRVFYLPWFMRPFDLFFSLFPSLSTELIVVARKL